MERCLPWSKRETKTVSAEKIRALRSSEMWLLTIEQARGVNMCNSLAPTVPALRTGGGAYPLQQPRPVKAVWHPSQPHIDQS